MTKLGICINEDNGHFYSSRRPEQMTSTEVTALVDTYASFTGLKAVAFCVNVRRALFASKVWEPLYHGYDPEAGPDQPALAGLPPEARSLTNGNQGMLMVHNLCMLAARGIDHPALWLERCRHHGMEGWLSMRMNDVHHSGDLDYPWHSTFWRTRPDLWRVQHKHESWWDRAFDYGKQEVRDHHMMLIRELFERYDMFGFEMDWIRAIHHFAPGGEQVGSAILTDFIREVRLLADEWSLRRGHPIMLGVRVPEHPVSSQRLGMDAPLWIREGLIDQVVLSQWLSVIPFHPPIALWRELIADRPVTLSLNVSTSTMTFGAAWPRKGVLNATTELLRGCAAAAQHQGVQRINLFNFCYMEDKQTDWLREIVANMHDPEIRDGQPRRFAVTYEEIAAPGESDHSSLPQRLDGPSGSRYGASAQLVPYVGSFAPDASAWAIVGFADDEEQPAGPEELTVRLNSHCCDYAPNTVLPKEFAPLVGKRFAFAVPPGVLHSGRNALEVASSSGKGTIVWAEIYLD